MAGTLRNYFQGGDAISMGGPRFRNALALDSGARKPDLVVVPKGAKFMGAYPDTQVAYLLDEGVSTATDTDTALALTNGGKVPADQWSVIPVQPGQVIAIYSETVSATYSLAFYERISEAV